MDRLLGWLRIVGARGWQLGGAAVGFFVIWTIFQRLLLLIVTIFISLLIAALLTPVARWVERAGVPRSVATLLALAGGALVVVAAGALVAVQLADQMSELTAQFEDVRRSVTDWLTEGPLGITEQQIDEAIDRATEAVRQSWGAIVNRAIGFLTVVGAFVTALVLAFFLIRDADRINEWILTRLVADDQREISSDAGRRTGEALQGYIRAVVIIGGLDALFIGLALVILGVPLAGPLALMTFFGGFFPVVGATVAGFLATLIATVSQGVVTGLIVLAVVIVVQQVDGNVFQPVIMGHAVHLHPIVVLAALTAGGILAGIVGAFMAVPTAAVLTAVGAEVRERREEQAVLSGRADADRPDGDASP